jgi:hypothetical protein
MLAEADPAKCEPPRLTSSAPKTGVDGPPPADEIPDLRHELQPHEMLEEQGIEEQHEGTYLSAENYSKAQQSALERALDLLDRVDARMEGGSTSSGRYQRHPLRELVTIIVPRPGDVLLDVHAANALRVWGHSISRRGLSFVCLEPIAQTRIILGIAPHDKSPNWYWGEIIRIRKIPEESCWEHGVAFRGRAVL